jgi:hypothetical protein
MKNQCKMMKCIFLLCQLFLIQFVLGQNFEVRTVQNEFGYLEVQIRETSGTNLPTIASDITDLQFEIRWLKSYGSDVDVGVICDFYYLVDGLGPRQSSGTYYWRVFAADQVPFQPGHNWVINQWESVVKFKVTTGGGSGSGSFSLAADAWVIQGLNFGIDGVDYTPVVSSNVTNYAYPTTVYDYVWAGGASPSGGFNQNSWTNGANWTNACGTSYYVANPPAITNRCIIPTGLPYYPTNFNNLLSGSCKSLNILSNALLNVPESITLTVSDEITVESGGLLDIKPGGTVTEQ